MRGLFISTPHNGEVYVAARSYRGSKFQWWSLPYGDYMVPDRRIDASTVPHKIRRQAYRALDPSL